MPDSTTPSKHFSELAAHYLECDRLARTLPYFDGEENLSPQELADLLKTEGKAETARRNAARDEALAELRSFVSSLMTAADELREKQPTREALASLREIRKTLETVVSSDNPAAGELAAAGDAMEAFTDEWILAAQGSGRTERGVTPQPKKLLKGWHEICKALGEKHDNRGRIKSLNAGLSGPIRNSGKGTMPLVDQNDLLNWWNQLASLQQDLAAQRAGAKLSAEASYAYGRDGTVAPEIGGGVKKRRSKK